MPTANLLTVKLLLNSVVSSPGAKFMTMDITNFYLKTPLKRKEYFRMKLEKHSNGVVAHYQLKEKAVNGFVYIAVKKGMYGLPQSGILAQKLLEERMGNTAIVKASYDDRLGLLFADVGVQVRKLYACILYADDADVSDMDVYLSKIEGHNDNFVVTSN